MSICFRQNHAHYKTRFVFGEEELAYTFDNFHTKVGGAIAYHKIPDRMTYREIKMWWLQYVALLYGLYLSLLCLYCLDTGDWSRLVVAAYFATLSFLCAMLLARMLYHGGISTFPLKPPLAVLHDGQQEEIFREIRKNRRLHMKLKLAKIESDRPYYEEANKFSRLREEGVISEEEYTEAGRKIEALRDKQLKYPPGSKGGN